MNLLGILAPRRSASVARERLQILLTHERHRGSQADLIPVLREEILKAVTKHVAVNPEKVQVTVDRGDEMSVLEINIEVPAQAVNPKKNGRPPKGAS